MGTFEVIHFGSAAIPVAVGRAACSHLSISVHPGGQVTATAPEGYTMSQIRQRLQARAGWVVKQLAYFEQFRPVQPPRAYVPGETHLYLGRQYRLRIVKAEGEGVQLKGKHFAVSLMEPGDPARTKELLEEWYHAHACSLLGELVNQSLDHFTKKGAPTPTLRLQKMRKRWGSCSPKGRLTLNVDLIRAPRECVEYVVLHELCHLLHPQHDRGFFRTLSSRMPDWQKRKERLERFQI